MLRRFLEGRRRRTKKFVRNSNLYAFLVVVFCPKIIFYTFFFFTNPGGPSEKMCDQGIRLPFLTIISPESHVQFLTIFRARLKIRKSHFFFTINSILNFLRFDKFHVHKTNDLNTTDQQLWFAI